MRFLRQQRQPQRPRTLTATIGVVGCLAAFLSLASSANAQPLQSGKPIPVGTNDGVGPLTSPGISSSPLGAVNVTGGERPDVFVMSDRWYPGLYLYTYKGSTGDGVPIFSQPIAIKTPFSVKQPPPGSVFEHGGVIYGVWAEKGGLLVTTFDAKQRAFVEAGRVKFTGLDATPGVSVDNRAGTVSCIPRDGGRVDVFISVTDGQSYRPKGPGHRDAEYRPYRPDGIWNGTLPREAICGTTIELPKPNAEAAVRVVLPFERGGLLGIHGIARVGDDLVYGTRLGGMYALRGQFTDGGADAQKQPIAGPDGVALRNPGMWAEMIAYPAAGGKGVALIVGCEGGVYYYQPGDHSPGDDRLTYELVDFIHQEKATLFGGTLVVPQVVDWNGDGALDIVAGNSQGFLLFFENKGSDAQPKFAPAVRLEAGGEPVHVQGGYRGSIQGPGESRWGYVGSTVVDWNGDGTLDILTNDINGVHLFYKNVGSARSPKLDRARPLYLDDLEMHGTWRTRPAAGPLNGRMAYVTLDDDDHFHLYWQVDERNLEDGGKLLLEDGNIINANFLEAGGTGRIRFTLADLDGDGVTDLLLGTPRHASVPDPEKGLPQSLGLPGAAVLFMRNTGSDAQPKFARPKLMHFKGKPVYLGQHECGPAVARFGDAGGLNIIVGDEHGRLMYYAHQDITWQTPQPPEPPQKKED